MLSENNFTSLFLLPPKAFKRHHMHSIRDVEAYLPAVKTSRRSFAERASTEQAMTGSVNCRHGAFKTGVGEVSIGLQGGRSLMMSPPPPALRGRRRGWCFKRCTSHCPPERRHRCMGPSSCEEARSMLPRCVVFFSSALRRLPHASKHPLVHPFKEIRPFG